MKKEYQKAEVKVYELELEQAMLENSIHTSEENYDPETMEIK